MHNQNKNSVKKSIPIVYEDETICIVNKPYGMPVQGGAGISVCLTEILGQQLGTAVFPVHRLDKQTTGLLVAAKTAAAASFCRTLFDSRTVIKEYLALCFMHGRHGTHNSKRYSGIKGCREGVIDTPISENGILKKAESSYKLIVGNELYSLISIFPHTGRMHQIRIHLSGIGCPIIGDDKHGDFCLNKQLWKSARIKKLQLCAYRLTFPIRGKPCLFTISLPEHIKEALQCLLPQETSALCF